MNRLGVRIFLYLFAAIALIGVGAVVITGFVMASQRQSATPPRVVLAEARSVLEDGGRPALEDWLRTRNAQLFGLPVLIIDETGRELLGRRLPTRAAGDARGARRLALVDEDGSRFQFVIGTRRPPLFGVFERPGARTTLLAFVLLVTALLSALLARSITRPILELQAATQRLAGGDLGTRVADSTSRRRDELGRLGSAFNAMALQLRSSVEGRERLLTNVSHELRSPLARMRLAAALAAQPGADAAQQLARIELEIAKLDGLIGGILDVARLESGEVAMQWQAMDLAALLETIVTDARFEAQPRGIRIDWSAPAEPLSMRGDPHWLGAAIENVIRNALRFSPERSAVGIAVQSIAAEYRITVTDTGPGVPAAELTAIFEPFHRVSTGREASGGGAGLGLAIAARVVRAHGGRILAERAEPGLRVMLSLPRDKGPR